jgi:dihydrolipoamide dehydrogenase
MSVEVRVPELGDFTDVDVIEVHVKSGDEVAAEAPLITLETDKASMDVPAPQAGAVEAVKIKVGDKVSPGDLILTLRPAPVGAVSAATASGGSGTGGSGFSRDSAEESRLKPHPQSPAPQARAPAVSRGAPAAARAPVAARETSQPRFGPKLVVIGSGPGGYTAAFRAADLGLDVTLIERYATLGGVCLNVGCIPSKALLHAARVIEEAHEARAFGLDFGVPRVDLDKLRGWKESVVGQLTKGLGGMAKQRKVEVVQGTARFKSARAVTVEHGGETHEIAFDQCIIAAGSEPVRLPSTPDDPRIVDSTGALELADLPEHLLVIGGGIIGLEMATVYEALGVKVSVVELTKTLMPGCDRDLVRPLERRLQKRYEAIMLGTRVTKLDATDTGITVHFEGDAAPAMPKIYSRVLVAVGRRPNGALLGAEAAGIAVDARGFLGVDKQMRTNVPHIYAIGDIVGQPMLAHKASHEGKVAAEAAAGQKSFFDARVVPSVAYTDPEVAWVGLTEEEAKAKSIAVHKGVFPWAASGRSLSLGRSEGMTKLLFDPESGALLGAGIVGPNAGDLIAEATLAIELGCDAADIGLTVHPHPTLSETLAFAAEVAEGTVTDLYIPKK